MADKSPLSLSTPEFFQRVGIGEDIDCEFKAAQGKDGRGSLPESTWETYSAMANTAGGTIVLGVREKDHVFEIAGVEDVDKVEQELWDGLNNRQRVSLNLLRPSHIQRLNVEGRTVIAITVPHASRTQRPIYIGRNPLTGTFLRRLSGDYRCDEPTVRRILADAHEDSRDTRVVVQGNLSDLDPETIRRYREEFRATKPDHPWLSLGDIELLEQLGGWAKDSETGAEGPTIAGILMFGKLRRILDVLPWYIVDYQRRGGEGSPADVEDRVTTDGSWSGNLFDFYVRTLPKLSESLEVPVPGQQPSKGGKPGEERVKEALKEALVNSLIHSDFDCRWGSDGQSRYDYPEAMSESATTMDLFWEFARVETVSERYASLYRIDPGLSTPLADDDRRRLTDLDWDNLAIAVLKVRWPVTLGPVLLATAWCYDIISMDVLGSVRFVHMEDFECVAPTRSIRELAERIREGIGFPPPWGKRISEG